MKQTIDLYDFRRSFEQCRPDNFSYEGLEVLFDHLEQYEQDVGEEMELDVISLCCDYSEDTAVNIAAMYDIDLDGIDDDDVVQYVIDNISDRTMIVGTVGSDSIIYQDF